jgi:hypothetical protein
MRKAFVLITAFVAVLIAGAVFAYVATPSGDIADAAAGAGEEIVEEPTTTSTVHEEERKLLHEEPPPEEEK